MIYRTHLVQIPTSFHSKDLESILDEEFRKWSSWEYIDHIRLSDVSFLLIFRGPKE